MLFSSCMKDTKEDILKKVFVHTMKASGVENTEAFFFCATQKKESHTGLKWHDVD